MCTGPVQWGPYRHRACEEHAFAPTDRGDSSRVHSGCEAKVTHSAFMLELGGSCPAVMATAESQLCPWGTFFRARSHNGLFFK